MQLVILYGSNKYGHYYYRCIERLRSHPFPARCTSSGVNAGILDSVVWNELKKKLFDYSIMKKYAGKWLKSLLRISSEDMLEEQRLLEMIKKVEEEETRYSKAYGVDTLEFDQFQSLMKDTKKRKLSYNKQLDDLASKSAEINSEVEIDELADETMSVAKSIDFTDKFKVIRDIIDKVTISNRRGVKVGI